MTRQPPGWLRRRWPLLMVLPVAALSMAWLTASPPTFAASALMRVPAGEDADDPGQPVEASYLAETYARLIPVDEELTSRVAELSGASVDEVRDGLSVLQVSGSSLLEVTATGTDEPTLRRTIDSLVQLLRSSSPVSDAIEPGVLVPVSSTESVQTSLDQWQTLLAAGFAGLLLAALLVVIFERMDPRIDSRDDASIISGCPTMALDEPEIQALVRAWDAAASHVQLVPLTPTDRSLTRQLRVLLERAAAAAGSELAFTVGEVPGAMRSPSSAYNVGVLRTGLRRSVLAAALRDLQWNESPVLGTGSQRHDVSSRAERGFAARSPALDLLLLCPRRLRKGTHAPPEAGKTPPNGTQLDTARTGSSRHVLAPPADRET